MADSRTFLPDAAAAAATAALSAFASDATKWRAGTVSASLSKKRDIERSIIDRDAGAAGEGSGVAGAAEEALVIFLAAASSAAAAEAAPS